MILVDKHGIKIEVTVIPKPYARIITPFDTPEEVADKKKKPFKLANDCTFYIRTRNCFGCFNYHTLHFETGYTYDGATIPPFIRPIVGQPSNLQFLLPALVHDKMCEKQYLVGNDRLKSSEIFKELLIACKVPIWRANIMFLAVYNYQKLWFNGW